MKFTITPQNLVRGGDNNIDTEVSISRDGKHIAYGSRTAASCGSGISTRSRLGRWRERRACTRCSGHPTTSGSDMRRDRLAAFAERATWSRFPCRAERPHLSVKLGGPFRRAYWGSDGETIVFCDTTGMYTVPARGGPTTRIMPHSHIEHPSFLDLPGRPQGYSLPGHGTYRSARTRNFRSRPRRGQKPPCARFVLQIIPTRRTAPQGTLCTSMASAMRAPSGRFRSPSRICN